MQVVVVEYLRKDDLMSDGAQCALAPSLRYETDPEPGEHARMHARVDTPRRAAAYLRAARLPGPSFFPQVNTQLPSLHPSPELLPRQRPTISRISM